MVRPVENYSEAVNVSFYMDVLNLTDLVCQHRFIIVLYANINLSLF